MESTHRTDSNAAKLAAINAFDARRSRGLLHPVLMALGPQPWFIGFYRRLGPKIDPFMSRLGGGQWMKQVYGLPGLVLHTVGAKSGKPRANPLLYVRDGDDFIVVGTNFGQPKHPAWTANLRAHPGRAAVEVRGIELPVRAVPVEAEEWQGLYERLLAVYPGYAIYLERRGDLPPRMFRLRPAI